MIGGLNSEYLLNELKEKIRTESECEFSENGNLIIGLSTVCCLCIFTFTTLYILKK